MTRRDKKHEERKVRASDFSMYQTAESRPTGLHHIFDAFHRECSSSTTVETSLSARSEGASSVYVEAGSELIKALDKLTKKDGTTKLKALETLEALLETTPDYVVEGVMPDFMHVFKRLAVVEPLRKIRLNLGKVLCRVAVMLKRRMQGYMESMVTHWFLAMHDDAQDVAAVYVKAFNSLFTTAAGSREERDRKTFRVLTHYIQKIASTSIFMLSRDIEGYKRDWLDVFGKTCDNCATVSDMHNRLMCSVLQSLTDLMIYQRQYGAEGCPDEHPVSVFLNSDFVTMISALCRSSSFKQRLATVRLMVEFVKVLRDEHLQLAKDLFKIGMQRIYADEEPSITYQHIRLICACARYNSVCWEPVVLNNYASLLQSIMDKHNGDFAGTIELYSLFPCLVSYLPQDWLRSPCGVEAVLKVTSHLLQLMHDKVNTNYETSFMFDAKLFSQVGSSMLYCYYRVLLLLGGGSNELVQHAFAPIAQLQCEDSSTAHYFVSQLPRIFTEFIEESVIFKGPEASDMLLSMLRDMQSKRTNCLFMARIFACLSGECEKLQGEEEAEERHAQLRLYARDAQTQLKSHIMNYELPSLVLEFLECPSSGTYLKKVDDMLSVVEDAMLDSIAPDSRIFELPHFLMSHKYADAWEFENAFGVLSRALVLFKPMLKAPLKHFPIDTHPASFLLISLLALQRCESAEDAVEIARRIYETQFRPNEGNVLAVMLKFIQASQRFASELSRSMLSWLLQHPHVSAVTCNAVYDCIDVTSLDKDALLSYELLYITMQLGQKTPSKSYRLVHNVLVDDLVSFYLLGYYVNSPVNLEVLLRFSLELLPCWRNGQSCADTGRLTSFLQLLLQDNRNVHRKNDSLDESHATKDVVYTMLAMQGTPCRATKSISRTLSALTSALRNDTLSTYYRNAVLFSHLWLMNCERYLSPVAKSVSPFREGSADVRNQTRVTSDEPQCGSSESLCTASDSVEETIRSFSDIFVATFVHSGFSCPMFEKLTDKLIELNLCTDVITDTLVRYFCTVTWKSKFEFESKLKLFSSYLTKSAAHANTMIDLFKQHYTVNQFVGGFVSVINRVNNAPIMLLDDLLLLLGACGKSDVVPVTNIISEMTQLFEDAICISQGSYTLKCMADSEYVFGHMAKMPLVVFGRLSVLGGGGDDVVSTCWLHHALIAFYRAYVNVMKALHLYVNPFLNLVGSVWLMSVLNFCYLEMTSPTNMTIIELLSDVIRFCLSHSLVSLQDLKARVTAYDYSRESAMEYAQVMEALSNDNLSRVLATDSMEESLETLEPHYMIIMLVHMFESADAYLVSHHADSTYIMQSSVESLKLAAYKFLDVCSKSKLPYPYSLCMISRLWRCSFLLSNIAEYSGALCKVDLERSTVCFMLPGRFVSNAIAPSSQASVTPKSVPVDVAQMLFNLLQDPEADGEETEEIVKTPKFHVSESASLRGRKAITFYLNFVLGPYLTEALFRIYAIYMSSGDHSDVEMCLTAWLSIFALLQQLKRSNQPTLVNSLVKILTVKPSDAGGVVYETLESEVMDATTTIGKDYVDAWWLQGEPEIPDGTEDSALHVLLQVLVLCLEHLECRDERHRNLVKTLYYRVSETFPEEVNHVWNQCRNTYVKKQIMKFTKNEITQRLITDELETLKRSKSSSLHISHDADHRTLYVSLDTKAEVSVKLTVKIPATFPLEPLSFVSTDDVGTFKNKHMRWLMMAQSTSNRSGISQGLLLWSENITNFFEGIEECPICYSIVHLQFNTIPGKTCKVCKHKFHTECLYKWFRNAPKAKCPLCQSHVSFTSYN